MNRWEDYLFQEGGWRVEFLLFPLRFVSWLYGLALWVRGRLYEKGLLERRRLSCKVISVGNITLGGTGKTPMVAYLARELQKREVKVGVLSRGYKGLKEREGGVLSDGENIYLGPTEAGDEPFMLAKMLKGVPLLVGRDRYALGLYALERFGVDVLILDDGFQHLGLSRDLDIVLIDARSGFGNGRLFPRGPLREPIKGLRRASLFVLSKVESLQPPGKLEEKLRNLAPTTPLYHSRYKPLYLIEAASGKIFSPRSLRGKRVLAFAGIADPGYFIHMLKELGAEVVKELNFPDHYRYGLKDLKKMHKYMDRVEVIVTTEKDYVKLRNIPLEGLPLFVLGITQEIWEEELFLQKVLSVVSS
ncbi:MAG: tetraacyldisaccharide 4'-kinase [Deltaproteobacteria bacterium]|nr:MAG: tetraacyldisaccharide 4'-kinase [Deltaproteobacteria bacterium]